MIPLSLIHCNWNDSPSRKIYLSSRNDLYIPLILVFVFLVSLISPLKGKKLWIVFHLLQLRCIPSPLSSTIPRSTPSISSSHPPLPPSTCRVKNINTGTSCTFPLYIYFYLYKEKKSIVFRSPRPLPPPSLSLFLSLYFLSLPSPSLSVPPLPSPPLRSRPSSLPLKQIFKTRINNFTEWSFVFCFNLSSSNACECISFLKHSEK